MVIWVVGDGGCDSPCKVGEYGVCGEDVESSSVERTHTDSCGMTSGSP